MAGEAYWEISANKLMNYVLYSKVYPKNVISSTTVWNGCILFVYGKQPYGDAIRVYCVRI